MVNKAAGSGVILTGYTQSRADLEAAYGEKAMAQVIEGNFNNLIMLRVRDKYTAELMTDQLPEVETTTVMQVSGATDSSNLDSEQDFTSSTQDRISVVQGPMLEPNALMSLPKGQAFMLVNGGELYKIRIPLPEDEHISIPETPRQMTEQMKRTGKERRVSRWDHESILDEVQKRLDTNPGIMRVRKSTVEHPFGTIKSWMGTSHFLTRRLNNVSTEMSLHVLAYNMKRVINILGVPALLQAIRA